MSALEELAKKASEKMAQNQLDAMTTKKVASKTYYSNIGGSTYIFADGTYARFTGGAYITDRQNEIEQLDALCKQPGNHHIYDYEVPVQNPNDSVLLREVGKGGTGMVSSANLQALAALSGRS